MDFGSFSSQFVSWAVSVSYAWGYIGIFFVNLLGNASIIFPVPSFLVVFLFGAMLNPWLVAVFSALGAGMGELTGYGLGFGGRKAGKKKISKWLEKTEKWTKKHGFFPVIILFAATPLPTDVIGIFCGAIEYNIKKFFLAVFIGKLIMCSLLAWGGFFGINWILNVAG